MVTPLGSEYEIFMPVTETSFSPHVGHRPLSPLTTNTTAIQIFGRIIHELDIPTTLACCSRLQAAKRLEKLKAQIQNLTPGRFYSMLVWSQKDVRGDFIFWFFGYPGSKGLWQIQPDGLIVS
jgi:hypothetical protein